MITLPPAIVETLDNATPGQCYVLRVEQREVKTGFYSMWRIEKDGTLVSEKAETRPMNILQLVPVSCPRAVPSAEETLKRR